MSAANAATTVLRFFGVFVSVWAILLSFFVGSTPLPIADATLAMMATSSPGEEDVDDEEIDPEFRLPYWTESESELEEGEEGTASSGYSSSAGCRSEQDIDWEWETYKISVAPRGPVPDELVLMTVACPTSGLYVKAVVDEHDAAVEIVSFEPTTEGSWQWAPTRCQECLERIEESLRIGGCELPMAAKIDEATMRMKSEEESLGDIEESEGCVDWEESEGSDDDDSLLDILRDLDNLARELDADVSTSPDEICEEDARHENEDSCSDGEMEYDLVEVRAFSGFTFMAFA